MKFVNTTQHKEHGSSILFVILLLGFVFVVGFSVSALVVRELKTTTLSQKSQEAYYAAESGVERAIFEVNKNIEDPAIPVAWQPVDGTDLRYLLRKDTETRDLSSFPVFLEAGESKMIPFFNPEALNTSLFPGVSAELTVVCEDCTSPFIPNMEVTIFSIPVTTGATGGFDADFDINALQDNSASNKAASSDESNIFINKRLRANANNPVIETLSNVDNRLYGIVIKSIEYSGTYSVNVNPGFQAQNVVTIKSFGDRGTGDVRRSIEISYRLNREPVDIFDYVLFSNDDIDIEACADQDQACN